ncbi:hypothetical protein LAZ67_5004447, partial [Cordylochernes scorpioides]
MKNKSLKGQRFEDLQEIKRAIKEWLRKQPQAYFQSGSTALPYWPISQLTVFRIMRFYLQGRRELHHLNEPQAFGISDVSGLRREATEQ